MASPLETLTEEDIYRLSLREAMGICDKCGIECGDLETLDDFKDLLIKILRTRDDTADPLNTHNIKEQLKNSIANYARMKKSVTEIYEELRKILRDKSFDDYIRRGLTKQYKEYIKIVDSNLRDLSLDDCPIVVTGETSAGKSSLLNLLLGCEILPTSVLRCTSAICRLRNSNRKQFVIHDYQGDTRVFNEMSDEEFRNKVKEYTSIHSGKQSEKVKYVDIYWPIPILQNNIIIVDTPGIGTSDQLTERLVEYLPKAVAFVYVINSPNDGGLQTDRLLKVIEQQSHWKKEGKLQTFDSSTAIFVCNKWDLIPKEEEEIVWEDIASKLKRYWPGMKTSQMFKLCVKNQRRPHVDQFRNLLESIQKLVLSSLELKIKRHLDWLTQFLDCICHLIASKINISKMGIVKRIQEIIRAKGMIKALTKKVKQTELDISQHVDSISDEIASKLFEHLQKEETRVKMFSWVEDDCPSVQRYYKSVLDVKRRAWEMILTRIEDEIIEWTNHNEHILAAHDRIVEKLMMGYQDVRKDLTDIQELLEGKRKVIKETIESPNQLINLHTAKAYVGIIDLFLEFVGVLSNPKRYASNRLEYMNDWTNEAMVWLTQLKIKECLNEMCFNDVIKTINAVFETSLHNRLQSDEEILFELYNFRDNFIVTKAQYGPLLYLCQNLTGKIEYFEAKNLSEYNIEGNKIRRGVMLGEGSFGFVYRAEFNFEGRWHPSAVKVTRRPLPMNELYDVFFEIKCLLYLHHGNVLHMYGYNLSEVSTGVVIQMVTELCDGSLDDVIQHSKACAEPCEADEFLRRLHRYVDIGTQICSGLSYIHASGYLHRDLKLENILVKGHIIKISDVGLAKPQHLTTGTYTGTPLYIAPEVMFSQYNPKSTAVDIYSMAFILWELWYGRRVEEDPSYQGQWFDLRSFVAKGGRPTLTRRRKPMQSLVDIIQTCWNQNPEIRPDAETVMINLCEIETNIGDYLSDGKFDTCLFVS